MSLEYIRKTYKVPAKRGRLVVYHAQDGDDIQGVIVGASGQYLRVRLGYNKHTSRFHPTWNLHYLPDGPDFGRESRYEDAA